MNSIVTFLIQFNQSLLAKIEELLAIIEALSPKKPDINLKIPKYKRFSVDKPPVVRTFEKLDYRQLIVQHEEGFGKTIKPVKSRGGTPVPESSILFPSERWRA